VNFSVTILGSGSAVPTSRRNPSAQYIQCSNRHLLIDCGEGTQMQLRKMGIKFQRIGHVFISHLHGDHYYGLIGLLSTMHLMGRDKPIRIYGPVGLKQIIELQIEADGGRLKFDVIFQELPKGSSGVLLEDEKIQVSNFPLDHRVPTSGFLVIEKEKERTLLIDEANKDNIKIEYYNRLKLGKDIIEDGQLISFEKYTKPPGPAKKYAYCSDTKYNESIIPFINSVDVLYHEATFTDKYEDRAVSTKHSTAKEAAKIAKKANVGRLLMGHLSARYHTGEIHEAEARTIYENSVVVEDGETYPI